MKEKTYKLSCPKHGSLWGDSWLRLGDSLFCPQCLADFLKEKIGELERD